MDKPLGYHDEVKLALHPGTLGWRVPTLEFPSLAAEAGFTAITLGQLPDDPHELDEIGNALAQSSVRLTAFSFPVEIRASEEAFLAGMPSLAVKASFARQAGCSITTIGIPASSALPFPQQRQLLLQRFTRCLDTLLRHNLQLALECVTVLELRRMHPFPFLHRFEDMLDFARSITPSAGLLLDSWHWHHTGSPNLDLPPGSVLHVHLADAPSLPPEQIRDGERLLPGEGRVDYKRFFHQLHRMEFGGDFAVEVFSSKLNQEPAHEVAARAHARSKKMLSLHSLTL